MAPTTSDGTNPFILLARITVSPGKLDAYLDIAASVDAAVEASEPGMLFGPPRDMWTRVYATAPISNCDGLT